MMDKVIHLLKIWHLTEWVLLAILLKLVFFPLIEKTLYILIRETNKHHSLWFKMNKKGKKDLGKIHKILASSDEMKDNSVLVEVQHSAYMIYLELISFDTSTSTLKFVIRKIDNEEIGNDKQMNKIVYVTLSSKNLLLFFCKHIKYNYKLFKLKKQDASPNKIITFVPGKNFEFSFTKGLNDSGNNSLELDRITGTVWTKT